MPNSGLPAGFQLEQPAEAATNEPGDSPPPGFELEEDKYGTPGQQALTGLEGLASGVITAPGTALLEKGLTALGVPGLTPEAQRGRAETNPWLRGGAETAGLIGSTALGVGEGALLGKIGEAAAPAAEGASAISKIASSGIRTGAEMSALQAGDELAKTINQDPGQTLGTAAINIGLSGIIGGAGGSALGAVSPLWKASAERMGIPKLIDDAKAQYNFRQALPNGGDVPATITDELNTRLNEIDNLRYQMGNLKSQALEKAMPEATPNNAAKIDSQLQGISDLMTSKLEKAADSIKTKSAVPFLAEDLNTFMDAVTNPNASFADKFGATNNLKRTLESYAKWGVTEEGSAKAALGRDLSNDIRPLLEDTQVWGDAGDIQKKANKAMSEFYEAEKVGIGKFTKKDMNGVSVSQDKVTSLVNENLKGKGIDRTGIIGDYIKTTDKLADTLNRLHTDAGLEAPVRLTPTPALNHTLGRSGAGTTLGNWLFDKSLASAAGHIGAETAGAGIGSLVGHPEIGALIGDRMLAPAFTSIARPLLETASHSTALKGSLNYVADVIRGDKIFNKATENFFKSGAEILSKDLIPNRDSRKELESSIMAMNNPDSALNIGGNIHHYLPGHATAAAAMGATAMNYLNSLKPTQAQMSPLDQPSPINRTKQLQYERALDVAQQPLIVLEHARNGTLQPVDVQTLATIYPQLQNRIIQQLFQEMAKSKADGKLIPYKQRMSLSLLMGKSLDSTMTQPGMMSIAMANGPKAPANQPAPRPKKPSKPTLASMEKVNSMYATPSQSREASRAKSS